MCVFFFLSLSSCLRLRALSLGDQDKELLCAASRCSAASRVTALSQQQLPCCRLAAFSTADPPPLAQQKQFGLITLKERRKKKKKKIRSLPLPRYPGAAVEARSETLTFWWDWLTGRKRAGCAPWGWGDQQVSYISLVPSCACFHALVSSIY